MASDEVFPDMWLLDNPQSLQIAVVFLVASCTLSFAGSAAVLYNILVNNKHKQSLYHRILLGMSAMDLVGSLAYASSVFAVPRTTQLYFAIGNEWTCRASGTLLFLVPALFLYHAELSLYFMLILRFQWDELTVSRRLEPFVHIFPILFAVLFTALFLSFDSIHPDLFIGICDLGPYPADCHGSMAPMCENARRNMLFGTVISIIVMLAVISGICSTWVAYRSVSRTYSRNRRHSFHGSTNQQMERRRRDMRTQSLLYTVAFSVMLGLIAHANVDTYSRNQHVPSKTAHLCFIYFVLPFQGSINFSIFFRLRARSWKEKNSGRSVFWTLWRAITAGEPVAVPLESRRGAALAELTNDANCPVSHTDDGEEEIPSETTPYSANDDPGTPAVIVVEQDESLIYPSLE